MRFEFHIGRDDVICFLHQSVFGALSFSPLPLQHGFE
jgi:hypothetical protein